MAKRPRLRCRFIPAGAGNTKYAIYDPFTGSVYPRWRGEHDEFRGPVFVKIGLSPLARGTLGEAPPILRVTRFIPAGAGNTYVFKTYYVFKTVYPRWRGEHVKYNSVAVNIDGLSPLARGTHQ
ncbi:hypothetical protein SEENIN0B_03039 [Salmonella enterica subsp. enterica serovar Infantis str. SARB27]|uniref:Uncharacterized protein n=1 Tax=Salmonella enterica subsp. enterica serovar Infantis str. SARB27 TaxID=596155 RepID=A0A6C8GAR6_SALIN|nr:hypothetical protein SEENIN0B_03039 [Salmonella enterica subsp. enterica serovar Infantis str. SARB27]